MMVIFPLLEPIVEFMFSHTMIKKFLKILTNMVCGVLNIVPKNPTFNAMVYKRTPTMSVGENHIIKKFNCVLIPYHDGWWNSFRVGF
jgi:hypothetical protein